MTSASLVLLASLMAGDLSQKPAPIFAEISIAAAGPFRFLVDTGAETSVIDAALAARLGLKPQYRVEQVTLNGTRLVAALKTASLRLGARALPETELLLHDVEMARRLDSTVAGILGLNALTSFDFTLSPATHSLDHTATRPTGATVPFTRLEGRLAVRARMGGEMLTLILDSGATHVVLFHTPAAMKKTPPVAATVSTIEGARAAAPTRWTADMHFADGLRLGMVPAAIVERKGSAAHGLLPAALFEKVYVDHQRQELVLVR